MGTVSETYVTNKIIKPNGFSVAFNKENGNHCDDDGLRTYVRYLELCNTGIFFSILCN